MVLDVAHSIKQQLSDGHIAPLEHAAHASFIVGKGFYPVREASEEPGSLKPTWPSRPMPTTWRSRPPTFSISSSYHWQNFSGSFGLAVRNVDILPGNVDMFEQVFKHEIVITLVVVRFQPQVFIPG